jgi:hypothetical protein
MARKDEAKAQEATDERPKEGYADVSKEVEQAHEDARQPIELDEDGNPKPRTSEAANVVNQEQAYRAGAQFNGGGPWPPELLRELGTTPLRSDSEGPVYTSHEVEHEDVG